MKTKSRILAAMVIGMVNLWTATTAQAHCDTLDGPVAVDAGTALETGDVTGVLKWVKQSDENQIKSVFESVQKVRNQGTEAKKIADRFFLETLIRIHRASEGAPYTGLKPAGSVEPVVASADKALAEGSVDALADRIGKASEQAVKERFSKVKEAKIHKDESVQAGREYVTAYVEYIHFVEGLHDMVVGKTAAHEHTARTETDRHKEQSDS